MSIVEEIGREKESCNPEVAAEAVYGAFEENRP